MSLETEDDAGNAALSAARVAWQRGDSVAAEASCRRALAAIPDHTGALTLLGIVLRARDPAAAETALRRAVEVDPRDPDAAFHLGNLHREQGNFGAAIDAYERTLGIAPRHPSVLNNLGLALEGCDELARAESMYRTVRELYPSHPKALRNLAHLLCRMHRYAEARPLCEAYVRGDGKDDADLWVDLGICQLDAQAHQEAEASFQRALALAADDALILTNLGSLYVDIAQYERAESVLARARELAPQRLYAASLLAYCRQHLCRWTGLEALHASILKAIDAESGEAVNAFAVLSMSVSAEAQLRVARRWAKDLALPRTMPAVAMPSAPMPTAAMQAAKRLSTEQPKLRLGYISSDFGAHPITFLLAEIWERHDRGKFETFAYSIARREASTLQTRIEAAFDRFVDCSETSIEDTADRIRRDGIDVLIDLNGYTQHARSEILALRPAPLQLAWLGYLGTLGAQWYDRIITDRFITPEDQQPFFSERFLYLPDCYCPSDTRREVAPVALARRECGLPEHGFVFCCFNKPYKILPPVFGVWMSLLQELEGAVLWLAAGDAADNLAREAAARGIDPRRLVFAPHVPPPEHLARHVHVDLFLDTFPYNAGTMANDALFMGLPVLTCAGPTMASRVAGSQLRAIGLPELVTHSLNEYKTRALDLARRPELIAEYRSRLKANRATHPLFDMARFAAALEDGLIGAWNDHNRSSPARQETAGLGRPPP